MERCEKLINLKNLINEFAVEQWYSAFRYTNWETIRCEDYSSSISKIVLVSEKFWFIRYLVENDLIDLELVKECDYTMSYSYINFEQTLYTQDWISIMVMELSLHIDPIDYLLYIIPKCHKN